MTSPAGTCARKRPPPSRRGRCSPSQTLPLGHLSRQKTFVEKENSTILSECSPPKLSYSYPELAAPSYRRTCTTADTRMQFLIQIRSVEICKLTHDQLAGSACERLLLQAVRLPNALAHIRSEAHHLTTVVLPGHTRRTD